MSAEQIMINLFVYWHFAPATAAICKQTTFYLEKDVIVLYLQFLEELLEYGLLFFVVLICRPDIYESLCTY
jgi:hypothetical protein